MHRLSNGTQSNAAPAPPAVLGTPGYPTEGNPATGSIPSEIDSYQAFSIQEEIAHVIEAANVALDKTNNGQLLLAVQNLIGTGTQFLGRLVIQPHSDGSSQVIAGLFVPPLARKAYLLATAGGGAGGSGNGGGGGGGSGGAGVEGWINVTGGAALTGSVGGCGITNAAGTGGPAASATTLTIGGTLICTLGPGNNGALGGSQLVAGSVGFGQVQYADPGLRQQSGQTGGNGLLLGDLMIGGNGGSSILGAGGLNQFTPVAANAAAAGNGSSFYGAAGSGGTGPSSDATGVGVGASGATGVVMLWFFA